MLRMHTMKTCEHLVSFGCIKHAAETSACRQPPPLPRRECLQPALLHKSQPPCLLARVRCTKNHCFRRPSGEHSNSVSSTTLSVLSWLCYRHWKTREHVALRSVCLPCLNYAFLFDLNTRVCIRSIIVLFLNSGWFFGLVCAKEKWEALGRILKESRASQPAT